MTGSTEAIDFEWSSSSATDSSFSSARLNSAMSYPKLAASCASVIACLRFPQTPAIFTTLSVRLSSKASSRIGLSKPCFGSRIANWVV